MHDDLFDKLKIELRRGALSVAVLAALREERYGYTLRQMLDDAGLKIDEGALYPLLRRLESQGLLTSQWREEGKRNKRFYRLSSYGEQVLAKLLAEWNAMGAAILRLSEGDD
jgi:DNA-binding PadR family transcriptional regulator